jgi:hypothetical protein
MDACRLGAHAARWVEKKAGLLRTPLVQAPGYCAAWSSTVAATAWCPSWITGAAAERRRRSNAQIGLKAPCVEAARTPAGVQQEIYSRITYVYALASADYHS